MLQDIVDEEVNDEYDENLERDALGHMDLANSRTINDILKYGAGHHSMNSNPGETQSQSQCSQSEWSDEDDEAKGNKSTFTHIYFVLNEMLNVCFFFCRRGRKHGIHYR